MRTDGLPGYSDEALVSIHIECKCSVSPSESIRSPLMPTACSAILKVWLTARIMELMSRYLQRYLNELVFRFKRPTRRTPHSALFLPLAFVP